MERIRKDFNVLEKNLDFGEKFYKLPFLKFDEIVFSIKKSNYE